MPMRMWYRPVMVFLGVTINCCTWAQQEERLRLDIADARPMAKIADRFRPRPKFLEINHELFNRFATFSSSEVLGNSSALVNKNLIRKAKIRFPILMLSNLNIFGGLGYASENFSFKEIRDNNYPLYQRLENNSLKRIAANVIVKKDLDRNRFRFYYFNTSLNSDRPQFNNLLNQLKLSVTVVLGKDLNPYKQIGYGLSFGYDLGQPTVFPLFVFKNDFSLHWGLELLLPKKISLRYSPNESMHFSLFNEVVGGSYHLQDEPIAGFDNVEFRRSALRAGALIDREVHDWLWLGLKGGYNHPIQIFISEPGKRRRDSIVDVDANASVFFQLSVFMVPPRKTYEKGKTR